MDVLSDTLRVVRLSGAVFFTASLASPWSFQSPPAADLARFLGLPTESMTLFHVLVEGECMVTLDGHEPARLETGDVVILPHGAPHVLSTDQRTTPQPMSAFLPSTAGEGIPSVVTTGPGSVTRFICGFLYCDQQFNPLMGTLPEVLVVSNRDQIAPAASNGAHPHANAHAQHGTASPTPRVVVIRPGAWLETTLRHTVAEAHGPGPGSAVMLARLAEMLFVEVLRRYMLELPSTQRGWLAGVKDPIVGHALQLIHTSPDRDWTVDDLAHAAAVSRSTLADRFTELIGEPPMRYLTRWRMQLAEQLLRQTNLGIYAVAARVGYASEAAFNRAFKRHVGRPPAAWRVSEG